MEGVFENLQNLSLVTETVKKNTNKENKFTTATSSNNGHTFSCMYSERGTIENLPFWYIPGRNKIFQPLEIDISCLSIFTLFHIFLTELYSIF
jgi:hypothetical protein